MEPEPITPECLRSLKAAELTGDSQNKLVRLVSQRESLGPNECAWGEGGIITTESRCTSSRCARAGRTHRARAQLTLSQRVRLFADAGVTHFYPGRETEIYPGRETESKRQKT